MKTRALVSILILVLAVLIVVGSCATEKKAYVVKENEELYGNWVNSEYNESFHRARHIINADGTIQLYTTDDSTRVAEEGEYIITEKWYDSVCNIWYKVIITENVIGSFKRTTPVYVLIKISNSGDTLETLKSSNRYPTEFDPDALIYRYEILYRQE